MSAKVYCLEFTYDTVTYLGLVQPFVSNGQIHYRLKIESEDRQHCLTFLLKPSSSRPQEWQFWCTNGLKADDFFDKELLAEIADQVDTCLNCEAESMVDHDLLFGIEGQLRHLN